MNEENKMNEEIQSIKEGEEKWVNFQGAPIHCIVKDGEVRFSLLSICDALEIDFEAQYKKAKKQPILARCLSVTEMHDSLNRKIEQVTLPLSKLSGWLFGLSVRLFTGKRRKNLEEYQEKCYDVLHEAFFGKPAPAPAPTATREEDLKLRRDAIDLRRWLVNRGYFDKDAAACLLDMVFAADAPVTIDPTKQYTDAENPYNPVPIAPPMLAAVAMAIARLDRAMFAEERRRLEGGK